MTGCAAPRRCPNRTPQNRYPTRSSEAERLPRGDVTLTIRRVRRRRPVTKADASGRRGFESRRVGQLLQIRRCDGRDTRLTLPFSFFFPEGSRPRGRAPVRAPEGQQIATTQLNIRRCDGRLCRPGLIHIFSFLGARIAVRASVRAPERCRCAIAAEPDSALRQCSAADESGGAEMRNLRPAYEDSA